jgi:hypothetical protein
MCSDKPRITTDFYLVIGKTNSALKVAYTPIPHHEQYTQRQRFSPERDIYPMKHVRLAADPTVNFHLASPKTYFFSLNTPLSGSFMSKKKFYLCFHGIST